MEIRRRLASLGSWKNLRAHHITAPCAWYNRIAMRELFFLGIITEALYPRSNNTGLRDDLKTIRGVTLRQHTVGMHARCTRACVPRTRSSEM